MDIEGLKEKFEKIEQLKAELNNEIKAIGENYIINAKISDGNGLFDNSIIDGEDGWEIDEDTDFESPKFSGDLNQFVEDVVTAASDGCDVEPDDLMFNILTSKNVANDGTNFVSVYGRQFDSVAIYYELKSK
jgi:hypothetical protein